MKTNEDLISDIRHQKLLINNSKRKISICEDLLIFRSRKYKIGDILKLKRYHLKEFVLGEVIDIKLNSKYQIIYFIKIAVAESPHHAIEDIIIKTKLSEEDLRGWKVIS